MGTSSRLGCPRTVRPSIADRLQFAVRKQKLSPVYLIPKTAESVRPTQSVLLTRFLTLSICDKAPVQSSTLWQFLCY